MSLALDQLAGASFCPAGVIWYPGCLRSGAPPQRAPPTTAVGAGSCGMGMGSGMREVPSRDGRGGQECGHWGGRSRITWVLRWATTGGWDTCASGVGPPPLPSWPCSSSPASSPSVHEADYDQHDYDQAGKDDPYYETASATSASNLVPLGFELRSVGSVPAWNLQIGRAVIVRIALGVVHVLSRDPGYLSSNQSGRLSCPSPCSLRRQRWWRGRWVVLVVVGDDRYVKLAPVVYVVGVLHLYTQFVVPSAL